MSEPADYYDLSRTRPEVLDVLTRINELGRERFAPRAKGVDDEASFPVENYRDLAAEGFLTLTVPEEFGGHGFSLGEYAMVGAEIGKYCGATALTFNMHNSSMMWSRFMYELPNLTDEDRAAFAPLRERQFRRAVKEQGIYSQPISEAGQNWTSKPAQTSCRKVEGGWKINGFKKFASLAGYCDYYSIVCTEHFEGIEPRHEDTMIFVVHKDAPGLSVTGSWDPLGMRGTNSRDLILKDVFVTEEDLMMPRGIFIKTLPHWPHMMATLSPTYMGVAQGAFDFTVAYLRGEVPGQPPADRRMFGTKRLTVGKMYTQLAAMRALWWQAFMEAQGFPTKAQVMRMYAAQYNVMEGVQEIAALAIRTCGGQSMLKTMPLERMYRDSRCGALMLPYTTEIMEDYLSVLTLYDMDELDRAPGDEGGARSSLWRGTGGTLKGLR
ncbi:acyl-CoA/acyl-ACP dehydrogenase (plasmid) [Ensifer adhaerens]|uniref:acyl-CoA dehydrogenase family protein n=1 Tax=Ensifer adhaerens TaxID=106592 RepID=UPI001CC04E05|nr:acyl-CoA dehydrogenase family protein [Ensifer adhaerens]MBZ7927185.1 acyl-CoA/acyl-ACP dehydrogenase [Ensifer adhaerens]UAX98218.1 acyl-CoA/acyl-ACP dehydrogenase [Ensifer adhaerens]UAY05600.1 acyl-CoA/acyl-ACP dehydrogenase [Ensifer adhaerens]UAY12978.1 acyl-CoA/acyl-ACP dehydrogenase [Ensifer adhaerens]